MEQNKKPKLLILTGPSGAGKSTWTRKFIQKNSNWVRVNRDDTRRQLVGELTQDYYKNPQVKQLEKHVTYLQMDAIRHLLQHGYNVVADNTHLKKSFIQEYVDLFDHIAEIEVKHFVASAKTCKERVKERDGDIDTSYIDSQVSNAQRLQEDDTLSFEAQDVFNACRSLLRLSKKAKKRKAYIVDIDGTIADCTGIRDPYDGDRCTEDRVIHNTIQVLKALKGNWLKRIFNPVTIIYLSGRENKWRTGTLAWLKKHKVPFDGHLYMRTTNDNRKDSIVKAELFYDYVAENFDVQGVFDDRLQVCHMWYKLGLFVFNVNQGLKNF
jgi:predicted kinase